MNNPNIAHGSLVHIHAEDVAQMHLVKTHESRINSGGLDDAAGRGTVHGGCRRHSVTRNIELKARST